MLVLIYWQAVDDSEKMWVIEFLEALILLEKPNLVLCVVMFDDDDVIPKL